MPARPHVRPFVSALVLAALASGAAACSSSSSTASKADTGSATSTTSRVSGTGAVSVTDSAGPNPCTIVTAAEVQAILGAAATASGPKSENRGHTCTWHPGKGSSVLVRVFQGKQFYDPSMQAPKAKKLTGIGDDAYLDDFGTTRGAVGSLKGDTAVFIDGFEITGPDAVVAAAKDAATKV